MKAENEQEGGVTPLKELRDKLGISQQELATRLGTSIVSVGRWERGDRAMLLTLSQMRALVRQLRSVSWDVEEFLERSTALEDKQSARDADNIPGALPPVGGDSLT
jgi:transcriptional regulator with XRE-family HTH domain